MTAGQAPRAHPERHRAHPGGRRHRDLPRARRGLPGAHRRRARKRKHVILLTDGQAPQNGIRDLVQAMAAEAITVTTVGLGGGVDESAPPDDRRRRRRSLLQGRPTRSRCPRIFTRETEMVSRTAAVEEYFQPQRRRRRPTSCAASTSRTAPFLHGYVATKMKPPPAQEILESELGEPILARWHVGLGWTLAWTSDVKNLWAVEWLRWPGFGQFWGQLVREHMRQKKRQQFDMRAEIDAATGHVQRVDRRHRRRRSLRERPRREAHRHGPAGPEARGRDAQGADAADGAGSLRGRLPARPLRLVPAPRVAREAGVDDGQGERQGACTRRRELRPRDESVSARVPRARAGPRHARARVAPSRAAGSTRPPPPSSTRRARSIRYHEDLWPRFVGAAIALFLLDLLVRRVRIFDRKTHRRSRRAPVQKARLGRVFSS